MRIAVIADIHGNARALEAVRADIARRVDTVINLGDCVSGPLWPAETMAILEAENWPCVRAITTVGSVTRPMPHAEPRTYSRMRRSTPSNLHGCAICRHASIWRPASSHFMRSPIPTPRI